MGMGLFSSSSSCRYSSCGPTVNVTSPNPDPRKFKILEGGVNKDFTIIKVQYEGCTNYEGVKILVYKGHVLQELVNADGIDPHFCEGPHLSPIARFAPTEEGLKLALGLQIGEVEVIPFPDQYGGYVTEDGVESVSDNI